MLLPLRQLLDFLKPFNDIKFPMNLFIYLFFYRPISIIVVVQVVWNAGDTGETVIGENVHVLVIQAVPKHIVARVACVSRGRRLENIVLLKG